MPSITHLNKPRLTEHQVDRVFNERRVILASKLDQFISNHPLFKDKNVNVFFAQKGVSSLVCILETTDQKLVLKIPLRTHSTESEGVFLKAWESVGVSVPHVLEEGMIGGHRYILMKYVDAPNLRDFYKLGGLVREKIFVKMGGVLRQMHTTKVRGYGRIVDGKPEYSEFKGWLCENDGSKEKFAYVKEHQLLNDEDHGSLEQICQIFVDFVAKNERIAYCHNDFAIENIFATTPMTVFDPDPTFNHPYIDLARAIVIGVSRCGSEVADQLTQGYFQDEKYDKRALNAAILIETHLKFPYWHKTGQGERIEFLRNHLSKKETV